MSKFLSDRSTTDIVVILFTMMVSLAVLIMTCGVMYAKIAKPELDTRASVELLGNVTTTVVGALVGFIGGRAAGRAETINGAGQ